VRIVDPTHAANMTSKPATTRPKPDDDSDFEALPSNTLPDWDGVGAEVGGVEEVLLVDAGEGALVVEELVEVVEETLVLVVDAAVVDAAVSRPAGIVVVNSEPEYSIPPGAAAALVTPF